MEMSSSRFSVYEIITVFFIIYLYNFLMQTK
jgi:hypothetical protein